MRSIESRKQSGGAPPHRERPRRVGPAPAASQPTASGSEIPRVLDTAVAWRPIGSLTPAARNARTHPEAQIHRLAAAIRGFGFTAPVLVDEDGIVLAGHARLEAARRLGLPEVPTLRLAGLRIRRGISASRWLLVG